MKRYFKLFLITSVSFLFCCVIGFNTLSDVWFKNRLNQNYNVPANEQSQTTQRTTRLCLIFAIDGVPFGVVKELHDEGYFKGFHPPGRLISTFPSITRPAFSRILLGGKPFGYERLFFDMKENQIKGFNLVKKIFSTGKQTLDYHPKLHFLGFPGYIAYVFPDKFTDTTLEVFKKRVVEFKGDEFIAYMGISDAIGHVNGKIGQKEFLKKISRLLDETRMELGIDLDVVVFSDHGNNYVENQRVDLASALTDHGFNDTQTLSSNKDFILLRNGFVSFAAIYTQPENSPEIAGILSKTNGVDFCAYLSNGSVMVQGPAGNALIEKFANRFKYTPLIGDPLKLKPIQTALKKNGAIDKSGFSSTAHWWELTKAHIYPDPLERIWTGLHDLVQHPSTLLVSFKDGYAFGPAVFDQPLIVGRKSTHGALLASHSNGFLMTDFKPVNPYNQPKMLAKLLSMATEAKKKTASTD